MSFGWLARFPQAEGQPQAKAERCASQVVRHCTGVALLFSSCLALVYLLFSLHSSRFRPWAFQRRRSGSTASQLDLDSTGSPAIQMKLHFVMNLLCREFPRWGEVGGVIAVSL
jgi:hypothetical protein